MVKNKETDKAEKKKLKTVITSAIRKALSDKNLSIKIEKAIDKAGDDITKKIMKASKENREEKKVGIKNKTAKTSVKKTSPKASTKTSQKN